MTTVPTIYNFDEQIERHGSGALKTDALEERYGRADLLPMWVADMDFATPPFIIDALKKRMEHPVLGYTIEPADYRPAIVEWVKNLHNVDIKPEWLIYIPGIVKGIGMAIDFFVGRNEKVIIQPPVYHPFRLVPEGNKREVVMNPLREMPDGRYEIDFENLEKVADDKCRMLILSNPHNPAGLVWPKETLARLADFCNERNIIVISDEIHSEMCLWNKKHVPFYSVSDAARKCSITFAAPSKTFNIAGIVSSYAIVPDDNLREQFYGFLNANEFGDPTIFAPIATIAAYREGEPWRKQMLSYIEENILFVEEYCREFMPQIKPLRPDASFLVWLDCRGLGKSHDELVSFMRNECRLALNDGEMFGHGGEGFMRLNVGTPRANVLEALSRIRKAIEAENSAR